MSFRFKTRLFFLFLFSLFFCLFFFSVVFNFSSFNNKQNPKLYNTTFKNDEAAKAAKEKAKINEVLTWLKTGTRLTDIVKYNVSRSSVSGDLGQSVSLLSLWRVDGDSTYESLPPDLITLLLKFDNSVKRTIVWHIKQKTEEEKTINEILRWLKTGTRLNDIKTYKIYEKSVYNKKADSYFNLKDLSLTSIKDQSTYETLSEVQKSFFLLFDQDIKDQIDNLIKIAKGKANIQTFLTWLKEGNRLTDIQRHNIKEINDGKNGKIALIDLSDLKTTDTYDHLEVKEAILLLKLSGITNAKTQIDVLIQAAKKKAKITETLTWLKKDNRLSDASKYEAWGLFTGLSKINDSSTYEGLTISQIALLLMFDEQEQLVLDESIKRAKTLYWLKANNRLVDIQTYKISEINDGKDGKTPLKNLKDLQTTDTLNDLSGFPKETLSKLSRISDAKKQIDDLIKLAKGKPNIEAFLTWLQNNDRLADIQTHNIREIDDDKGGKAALGDLSELQGSDTYETLELKEKSSLLTLSAITNAKTQIDDLIKAAKEKIKIDSVLVWLKDPNLLADIQTHKISDSQINDGQEEEIPLSDLKDLQTNDNYDTLEPAEKTLLLKLSQISNAKKQIDDLIKAAEKKVKIDEVLAWLQTGTRLAEIAKYNIASEMPGLANINDASTYESLLEKEKTFLLKFDKAAEDLINKLINDAKAIETVLEWLKKANLLADIVKYKIADETVQDDDKVVVELSELANITAQSNYESLPERKKKLLLTLSKIADAKKQIDDLIKAAKRRAKTKINERLVWLKEPNRLNDIAKYNIASKTVPNDDSDNVDLSEIVNIKDDSTYDNLLALAKDLLLKIDETVKTQIVTSIETAKENEKAKIVQALGWLKEPNLLANIKKYKISAINDGTGATTALSDLSDLKSSDNYDNLDEKEKDLLLTLSQINSAQEQIEVLIETAKEKALIETVLEWLKADNRLADIQTYKIREIDDGTGKKTPLGVLKDLQASDTYDHLEADEAALLWILSQISDAQTRIDTLIKPKKEKAKINELLAWLQADNRLEDIAKYNIASEKVQNYDGIDVNLAELANIKNDSTYENLPTPAKSLLLKIDESVKSKIDALIKVAKEKAKINEPLTWLKDNNRLVDIVKYNIASEKVQDDDRTILDLSELVNITDKSTYESLSKEERALLLKVDNNVKKEIDALIKDLKAGVDDLIKNFQTSNSILTKLKDLRKNKIKVKGKDLSFRNLLKVKDWKKPNTFQNMKPQTRKELLNIMKSLSNNRKRIPAIDSAIEKMKNTQNINSAILMWMSIGLGIFLLLMVSLFTFKYLKNKNNK